MTGERLHLKFPNNDTDEDEGLSDAGIETFKGVPYSSVARESGQNSRDAVLAFPVRMSFDVISIRKEEIPDFDSLSETIDACHKRANERNEQKEKQFFSKARKLLNSEVLYGLRISDEGTTGLIGPCTPGKPFHSLVKASGVTNKNDPTSGGSFGIGKRAAFAVSDLHAVFYSTIYNDGKKLCYLAQGKCTLVSHEREGAKLRATGYWGTPGYMPVDNEVNAPTWLRRNEIGTTAVSLGFSASEDWKHKITESLVRNFFAAIHRQELEFQIDNSSITLNRASLADALSAEPVKKAADAQGTREELEFSRQLYECLLDVNTKEFTTHIPEVGSFTMHLLVKEDLPKRVAIIRNGMVITDNLQRFGDKLAHFPMYKEFVAVLEPSDQRAKTTIKRLENPEHNDLSADRLIDEIEKKSVRKGMSALRKWVRECIKSEAFVAPKEEVTLEEMNEFFGDMSNTDRIPSQGDGDTHPLAVTYKPIKRPRQAPSEGWQGVEEDEGGGADGQNDSDGGTESGDGSGSGGGAGGRGSELLAFEDFRNVQDQQKPETVRSLFFTPAISGRARVGILAKGMNNDVAMSGIRVLNDQGESVATIDTVGGQRKKLTVVFPASYEGPISLVLQKAPGEDA